MANPIERYKNLGLRDALCMTYRYPMACKELGVILRLYYSKSLKPLQSLLLEDTLFAFHLLPQMQTQSAVSAANLLIQSAESVFPKQKRALAASEFKQAKIAYKRRGKILQDIKDPVNLPQDVLVHLFSFLDVQSLLTAGSVCRSWNAAANDSYLWQFQYLNLFDDSEGLADGKAATGEQHAPLSEVCTSANRDWKVDFRKAYLGLPSWRYKFDRGYCSYCKTIVWFNNLNCPNQHLGQRAKEHQLAGLAPSQIGKYIVGELLGVMLMDSDIDSGSDDEDYVPSTGIWERC